MSEDANIVQARIKIDDMPQFSIEPERLSKSLARALPDFSLMIAMIIIFFVGSYISFLHYDVR
jgi:hypothetical protein